MSARERAGLKVGGKPVIAAVWERTVYAVGEFNRQASKDLAVLNGRGQPSETAKRVYGRLRDHPLDEPAIADVIARTLASRWWGDDAPSIGVVFGPNVFEDNLTREVAAPKDDGWTNFMSGFNATATDAAEDADVVDAEAVEV